MKVKIIYPNHNIYKGDINYDTIKKKYVITGMGTLEMPNKGIFTGPFLDGNIHGIGKY